MNIDAIIWFAVAVATAVAFVALIVRSVRDDGYGRGEAPTSHRTDWGTGSLPSTPYAFHG